MLGCRLIAVGLSPKDLVECYLILLQIPVFRYIKAVGITNGFYFLKGGYYSDSYFS